MHIKEQTKPRDERCESICSSFARFVTENKRFTSQVAIPVSCSVAFLVVNDHLQQERDFKGLGLSKDES